VTNYRSTWLRAALFGVALFAAQANAQTAATGQSTTSADTSTSVATYRDGKAVIGAGLSTTGGRYGTIVDLVYDGSGAVRYALVEHQGQTHPVPFSLLQFGATGDATVAVSSASLDTITVDRSNLQSMNAQAFLTQLRIAYGANVAGALTSAANATSTASQPAQLYSLNSLLGGTISAVGGAAGTIADVAIAPNGRIAYAVGSGAAANPSVPNGMIQFAVPFAVATLNSDGTGLSVNVSTQAVTGVTLPQGTLPAFSNAAFAGEITTAFGSTQANSIFGMFQNPSSPPRMLTAQQRAAANRADPFYTDPVVRAGDSSQAGANAVANAGDASRGGANACRAPATGQAPARRLRVLCQRRTRRVLSRRPTLVRVAPRPLAPPEQRHQERPLPGQPV